MKNRTLAKAKNHNSTTFLPVFCKKLSGQTFTPKSANNGRDISNPEFGHNFGDVQVESPSSKQSCPLSLSGPSHCPFGVACHTCAPTIQTKLKIGQPNDKYEQEADRVAEQVMRMPEPQVQRKERLSCDDMDEEEQIQTKPVVGRITPLLQRQVDEEEALQPKKVSGQTPGVTKAIATNINNLSRKGKRLPASERSFFDRRFGYDFSQVRVHSGSSVAPLTRFLNARAFTVGRDVVFGSGQYVPETMEGRQLLAHELSHVIQQEGNDLQKDVPKRPTGFCKIQKPTLKPKNRHLIQRAEVDDNPAFCFPPRGTPLRDSKSTINGWIAGAKLRSKRKAIHIVNAIYKDLGTGTGVTKVEKKLATLPKSQVRHVKMSESRYDRAIYSGMWPVDPLSKFVLWAAGKISVAPVINLCGVCVGTDKVGHFFQQGYEYFRLVNEISNRVKAMSLKQRKSFYTRLTRGSKITPLVSGESLQGLKLLPSTDPESIAEVFAFQFGLWLEGFNNNLSKKDIKWIKKRKFIPFYYSKGIYGSASTGVLSRADLRANTKGYWFFRELWSKPKKKPNICEYVDKLWNEREAISTFLPLVYPTGPKSESMEAESP